MNEQLLIGGFCLGVWSDPNQNHAGCSHSLGLGLQCNGNSISVRIFKPILVDMRLVASMDTGFHLSDLHRPSGGAYE